MNIPNRYTKIKRNKQNRVLNKLFNIQQGGASADEIIKMIEENNIDELREFLNTDTSEHPIKSDRLNFEVEGQPIIVQALKQRKPDIFKLIIDEGFDIKEDGVDIFKMLIRYLPLDGPIFSE